MIRFTSIEKSPDHALKLRPAHVRDKHDKIKMPRRKRGANGAYPTIRGTPRFLVNSKRQQLCVIKVSYTRNSKSRSWAAHGEYLQREHAQTVGEKGHGFNDDRNDLDLKLMLHSWQQENDQHLFKLIISPENGHRMDLQQHAKDLIAVLEKDLGTKLQWAAINHNNTDHPYLHLLIRGVDDRGNALLIDPDYLKHSIRQRSQELATRDLGLRRENDLLLARERQLNREQVTALDRAIQFLANEHGVVDYATRVPDQNFSREQRLLEIKRLKFLETLGLAQQLDTKAWQLSDKLESNLHALRLSNDIVNSLARHNIQPLSHELPTPKELKNGQSITGKVVGMGLEQALHDKRYLIIESNTGHVHYIQATNSIVKAYDNFEFGKGNVITLTHDSFVNDRDELISFIKTHNHGTLKQLEQEIRSQLDNDILFIVRKNDPMLQQIVKPEIQLQMEYSFGEEYRQALRRRLNEFEQEKIIVREQKDQVLTADKADLTITYRLTDDWEQRFSQLITQRQQAYQAELKREFIHEHTRKDEKTLSQENTIAPIRAQSIPELKKTADQQRQQLKKFQERYQQLQPKNAKQLVDQLSVPMKKLANSWRLEVEKFELAIVRSHYPEELKSELRQASHGITQQKEVMQYLKHNMPHLAQQTELWAEQHQQQLKREREQKQELERLMKRDHDRDGHGRSL